MDNNSYGKTLAALLIGATVGAAVGYILGADKEKRNQQLDQIKNSFESMSDKVKSKFKKTAADIEEEIFSS